MKKLHSKCQWNVQILTKYSSIWFNTYLYLTCFQHHKLETKTQHSIDYNLRNSLRWYFVVWYRISRYMYGYSSLNIKAIHVYATLIPTFFIWLYFYHIHPLKHQKLLNEQGILNLTQTEKLYQHRITIECYFIYKESNSEIVDKAFEILWSIQDEI